MKSEYQLLGRISLQALRDIITEKGLNGGDAILINQYDFDSLAEEYRETYGVALEEPFYIGLTLIAEDNTVPKDNIALEKNTLGPRIEAANSLPTLDYSKEKVYRCGWCGNVVDFDGSKLDEPTQTYKINLLEKHIRDITLKYVGGYCCLGKIQ